MKKIFLYLILFVLICFILPAIFTKRIQTVEADIIQKEDIDNIENILNPEENNYKYMKFNTIRLLHKNTNETEEVDLDEYLCNVVSAEMPADYQIEALKAQAIVARTYTIYKILNKKHGDADICDDYACCQAWISKEDRLARWDENKRDENWIKISNAVNSTKGKIITYNGQVINAFFHSNSGGKTEIPVNVWGGTGYPYLQVVETSGENEYSQYNSECIFSQEELVDKLKAKYKDISIDFSKDNEIQILEFTESGRVKTVKFGNYQIAGVEIRTLLGLKSTNFEIIKEGNNIKFSVIGYGHGVGMSQTGADAMAKQGNSADEIIKHFYIGIEISDINSL